MIRADGFTIDVHITAEAVEDILITACENGPISYWCTAFDKDKSKPWFNPLDATSASDKPWYATWALFKGGKVALEVPHMQKDDGSTIHYLTRDAIFQGLALYLRDYSTKDLKECEGRAVDIFMQLALFGEVVFQ